MTWTLLAFLSLKWPEMRPVRDARRMARHFSTGGLSSVSAASPVGTAEISPAALLVVFDPLFLISRPYGTRFILLHNPGTEVPGYLLGVPLGLKIAKLRCPEAEWTTQLCPLPNREMRVRCGA